VDLWYDWNWSAAEREIGRALQLNPDSPSTLITSETYLTLVAGRFDDAARASRRIVDLDPLNPFSHIQPFWVAFFSRRFDDSIRYAEDLRHLWPNHIMAPWFLASNDAVKRDAAGVRRECGIVMQMLNGAYVQQAIAVCAWAHGMAGSTEDARRLVRALESPPPGAWIDPTNMALAYGGIGDIDRAMEWARRGLDQHAPNMIYVKNGPTWDFARADARFQAIVRDMKFPN